MNSLEFQTPADAELFDTLKRKPLIRRVKPREYIRQRLAEAAASLSLAGMLAARVELANEALHRLVQLLYERDTDGVLANVDPVTYRLLIPAPWGRAGWRSWGLRQHEGVTLRGVLRTRQAAWHKNQRPLLFDYNEVLRSWHINIGDYGVVEAAVWWLEKSPVTLAEWRACSVAHRLAD